MSSTHTHLWHPGLWDISSSAQGPCEHASLLACSPVARLHLSGPGPTQLSEPGLSGTYLKSLFSSGLGQKGVLEYWELGQKLLWLPAALSLGAQHERIWPIASRVETLTAVNWTL